MKCIACGAEGPEGARFCRKCGADFSNITGEGFTQPDVPQEEHYGEASDTELGARKSRTKPPKRVLIIAGVLVVVVAAIVLSIGLGLFSSSGGKGAFPAHSIIAFYLPDDDETVIVIDGVPLNKTIDGDVYYPDDTLLPVYNDNYSARMFNVLSGEELYYVSTDGIIRIADAGYGGMFATQGKAVAFIDDAGALNVYDLDTGRTREIDVVGDSTGYNYGYYSKGVYRISPDGKTVAYLDQDNDLYIDIDGKATKIDSEVDGIIGLSNSAQYLYYTRNDSLYVSTAGSTDRQKVKSNVDSYSFCIINRKNTELIFCSDEKMYHVKGAGEAVYLGISASYGVYDVMPLSLSAADITGGLHGTLLDRVYIDEDGGTLYYVSSNGESNRITRESEQHYITKDGKTLFYSRTGSVYRVRIGDNTSGDRIAEDVTSFTVSLNGKYVYYIDRDADLYCIEGSKDARRIASDVSSIYMTHDGILLFINDDDTLYSCSNGKDYDRVADDVDSVLSTFTATYYFVEVDRDEYKYDVYAAVSGTRFERILEDVEYCYDTFWSALDWWNLW